MSNGVDLSKLYSLRKDFTIIALTGRTGSGCTTIASQLTKGFDDGSAFPAPTSFISKHNSYRKYAIIHKYAKVNFLPYVLINYREVMTLFVLKYGFDDFIDYLNSNALKLGFQNSKLKTINDFQSEIELLRDIREEFESFKNMLIPINLDNMKKGENLKLLYDIFFSDAFKTFSLKFHDILKSRSIVKRNKTLQIISNNLRKSGKPYSFKETDSNNIFTISKLINNLIKSHKKVNYLNPTKVVIDSLRNPLEIMFFKQRYAAFYVMTVNRDNAKRDEKLRSRYTEEDYEDVLKILEEEYKGGKGNEFYKPYVRDCIEKADIHISYKSNETAELLNKLNSAANDKTNSATNDNTSPYYSWSMQLLKYVSLIDHPGLITPSPEERCMQLAFTAKYNSGCISRQVGAAITDHNYSVKSIGWNNTPEGQVPCNLRNVEDLLNNGDVSAYTPYEIENEEFKDNLKIHFPLTVINENKNIQGRNVCFCFKSIKNSYSEGKNQVHTRSLHAEESAFLQITKYGGTGIKGGKLFTTASPCELCSKKAYQLGIKVIYYIDPYPGISQKQILEVGNKRPEVRLFNGAIGNAYHWLYEPLLNYKDEQSLILGQNIKDIASEQSEQIEALQKEIADLKLKYETL